MKKYLINYVVTVVDESDGKKYDGEFLAKDAIDAMNKAIEWYTEALGAMPNTIKLSNLEIKNLIRI